MKKIKLELTAAGAQVMHGAVQKRLEVLQPTSTQGAQEEKALLSEANRELAAAIAKAADPNAEGQR